MPSTCTTTARLEPRTPPQGRKAPATAAAGSTVARLVRDPQTGAPSRDKTLYREVVRRIREADSDVLNNLTTGPGARFVPHEREPNRNGYADGMATWEERMEHVLELRPDICSLDVGTMCFSNYAFVNVPRDVERMALAMREAKVKPEVEVFELGHAAYVRHLCEKKVFAEPPWVQLCLGISWAAPATTDAMQSLLKVLPANANWSAFGIARHQFPMAAQAMLLGGHLRVGLEDNLYLRQGVLAEGNAPLVERAVRLAGEFDREVATPAQARDMLEIG